MEKNESLEDVKFNNEESNDKDIQNHSNESSPKNGFKKKSAKKNYFYNLIYQLFLVIVPLVVTPYISRVLLPDGVGKYSFAYSIITYFSIVAALGFNYYAQREIAKHQGDKAAQSKSFWEIIIARCIPTFLALITNVILCFFNVYQSYNTLMWIFSINVIAVAFDVAFYFQGNEDFGKIVLRNVIIKSISIALIFIFVKTPDHLWIYAIINSLMLFASNISLWGYLPKYLVKVSGLKPLRHLKDSFILFLPTIATSVYLILDKTLIGLLVPGTYTEVVDGVEVIKKFSDLENGYYEQSEKIVKMVMVVITCIGTVMIPRNTHEFAVGNYERVKQNVYLSSRLVFLLGVPMTLGIVSVAANMVPWFFGDGYDKCVLLMSVLAPLILIIGFTNVFGVQYLIPSGQNVKFTIGVVVGAVVNLTLNLILIPHLWSLGAAIATIIGELVVSIVMILSVRKTFNFFKTLVGSWKYIISGGLMFLGLYFIKDYFKPSILNTALLALIGIVVYFTLLLILRDKLLLVGITKAKNRLMKKKTSNVVKEKPQITNEESEKLDRNLDDEIKSNEQQEENNA